MQTDFFQQATKVLTVGELTRAIRAALETRFGAVWVQGEVSNYKLHPSGHQYFTLKDHRAQIACVIFRNTLAENAPRIADGAQVQVFGQISVFEARGQYQLSVQILQTRGLGLLQAKFEALKRKLEAEGLFDSARKRKLPKYPKRIGIVTSPSGAAIRDMLNVLQRRAPALEILINPVRVQGSGAAAEIAVALRELSQPNECWQPPDLIVIARGGGSIEDLWEFNEEIVARAIFDSPTPVVSAIGHEIDFTIADFVADLRAPTPSAAAELIVADVTDILRRLTECAGCLERYFRNFISNAQTRLRFLSEKSIARELNQRLREVQQATDFAKDSLGKSVTGYVTEMGRRLVTATRGLEARSPARELAARKASFDQLQARMQNQPARFLANWRQRFARSEGMLRLLGPQATLQRGYSITTHANGEIVRSVKDVALRELVRTRLANGTFESRVGE